MCVGELLYLAKVLHEARAPLGATVLLIDEACEKGAEPLTIRESREVSVPHLSVDAEQGALFLQVSRRTLVLASGDPRLQ